ncbi:MAG: ABC transporter substrate-binding protein [Eubacteriales bacterium]|nr:ABC transporter substrate-binding protein [Eubacteriales bacterium]
MKKRIGKVIGLTLVAAMSMSLLAGCGGQKAPTEAPVAGESTAGESAPADGQSGEKKDSAILATSGEPTRFYPCGPEGSNGNDYLVLNNIYDTLVFLNADGTLKPCLATEWSVSEDGLCYTFKIREGVKFHDGSEMTPEDVVFSFDQSVQNSTGKALIINYDHAEVGEDNTVNIYLTAPYAAFLNGCASRAGGIISKAYFESAGAEGYQEAPIGTGPYKFVSAVSGDTVTLEAFEDYWNGPAAIKNIYIRIMTDATTQIISLENGDIDAINAPAISNCLNLNEQSGAVWESGDSAGRVTLHLSSNKGQPAADDNFRKAVQYAINKEDVIAGTTEGYASRIDIDMCASYSAHPEGYKVIERDVEKAKEYLAASNYNNEEFEIIVVAGSECDAAAQIIQAQLMEIGINCVINAVDTPTFNDMWYGGTYGGMIRKTSSSLLDADGFLNFFMATEANYAQTLNNQHPRTKEIYDLGMEARKAQGEDRKELYRQMVDICTDEAYEVPLFADTATIAYRADLQGIKVYPLGVVYFYDWTW